MDMEEKEGIKMMRLKQSLAALLFGLYIISPAFNINFVIFLYPKFLLSILVSSFFHHISHITSSYILIIAAYDHFCIWL